MSNEEVRTARLILRRLCESDLGDLLAMNRDERVMATMGGTRPQREVEDYLRHQIEHWERHGFGWWMVLDAPTGAAAGRGGLRYVEVGGRVEVEVGYSFFPRYWGLGLATELALMSVDVGFATLRLPELVSFTLATNVASRRVMEKSGFEYERDVVYKSFASVLCRQTRAAWQTRRATAATMVRPEDPSDEAAIRAVVEAAFGCTGEADLVEALRAGARPFVSLVAERNGRVVGHVCFSPVTIGGHPGSSPALGLAPLAVAPPFQNQGIGAELVRAGLQECKRLGADVVVVLGHPAYYSRFGFVAAKPHGLTCEYSVPEDTFMVAELQTGAVGRRSGLVAYHPAFAGL